MSETTIERKPYKLARFDIKEHVAEYLKKNGAKYPDGMKMVNVRGCNGAGKSTVPLSFLFNDPAVYLLTYEGKDIATVFPTYGWVAMGRYRTKTGGLDGYKNGEQTRQMLQLLWCLPFNIIMEGVIASTIYSTYADLFNEYKTHKIKREIGVMNLLPPFEVIKDRLEKRNGGKEIKWEQVESKYRTVKKNAQKFLEAGLISWEADNSGIERDETLGWFLEQVEEYLGAKH